MAIQRTLQNPRKPSRASTATSFNTSAPASRAPSIANLSYSRSIPATPATENPLPATPSRKHSRPKIATKLSSAFKFPKSVRIGRRKSTAVEEQSLLSIRPSSNISTLSSPTLGDGILEQAPSFAHSSSSTATLTQHPEGAIEEEAESAAFLLDLLAPLIAGIQKLTAKIIDLPNSDNDELSIEVQNLCMEVEALLGSLKITREEPRDLGEAGAAVLGSDNHDREMRDLMLSALLKKVQVGKRAVRTAFDVEQNLGMAIPSIEQPENIETSNMLNLAGFLEDKRGQRRSSSSISSPLREHSDNPFIVHSTSLSPPSVERHGTPVDRVPSIDSTLTSSHGDRQMSTSIPIGIPRRRSSSNTSRSPTRAAHVLPHAQIFGIPGSGGTQGQIPPGGSFSAFVGGAQSSLWATNIRLASFQNSLLFSPSPIAVRRIVGHGATRL